MNAIRSYIKCCKSNKISDVRDESLKSCKQNQPNYYFLGRSLALLWKLTYYGGLLFDWCDPIEKSFISILFHCVVIVVGLSATVFQTVVSGADLKEALSSSTSVQAVVSTAIEFSYQIVIIITWVYYLCRRKSLLAFFNDWEKHNFGSIFGDLHTQQENPKPKRIVILNVYLLYASFSFGSLCFDIHYAYVWKAADNFVISFYPSLSESFVYTNWCRLCLIIQGISCGIFYSLLDIVPIIIYYHGSKLIQVMKFDIDYMISTTASITNDADKNITLELKTVWARFENLRILLHRADGLFGSLMILSHGDAFFIVCTTFYSLLNVVMRPDIIDSDGYVGEDPYWKFGVFFCFFFHLLRIVIGVFLISKVSQSSSQLRSTVACLMLRRCSLSDKEERRIIKSFMNRLENNQVSACTAGFYNITPSVLLTLLSLIVSYTIILLQSNNDSSISLKGNLSNCCASG